MVVVVVVVVRISQSVSRSAKERREMEGKMHTYRHTTF